MKLQETQYSTRATSVLTGGEIEHLHTIKDFPVFIGATSDDPAKDLFHDLTFDICKETGLIQLRHPINPSIVYSKYHCEAIGKVWLDHHDRFSDFLIGYCGGKNVLEIGGSDSRIAISSLNKNPQIKSWTLIEPTIKSRHSHDKLFYREEFFGENTKASDVNTVVHSHTIEHMYDPKAFLANISRILKDGDYHIFSAPNLYKYLKNKYSNVINFEHTLFLSERILDYLLSYYGFIILDKFYYDEHSIFYVTQKYENAPIVALNNHHDKYKQMYLASIDYYKNFVLSVNERLERLGGEAYLFGGHVFSQLLISLGLNVEKIVCILDNSEIKNGQRLYGSNLTIRMPRDTKFKDRSAIVLKVGQYQEEVRNQLFNMNGSLIFYE